MLHSSTPATAATDMNPGILSELRRNKDSSAFLINLSQKVKVFPIGGTNCSVTISKYPNGIRTDRLTATVPSCMVQTLSDQVHTGLLVGQCVHEDGLLSSPGDPNNDVLWVLYSASFMCVLVWRRVCLFLVYCVLTIFQKQKSQLRTNSFALRNGS